MSRNFNETFSESGEKPDFMYKRNPLVDHAYQIFYYVDNKNDYELAGEYIVLDTDEDIEITEKKVMNVVSFLNGKDTLIDVGNLTKTRILFNMVPVKAGDNEAKIIFREHDGKGVSSENAVLTLQKGVIDVKRLEDRIENRI